MHGGPLAGLVRLDVAQSVARRRPAPEGRSARSRAWWVKYGSSGCGANPAAARACSATSPSMTRADCAPRRSPPRTTRRPPRRRRAGPGRPAAPASRAPRPSRSRASRRPRSRPRWPHPRRVPRVDGPEVAAPGELSGVEAARRRPQPRGQVLHRAQVVGAGEVASSQVVRSQPSRQRYCWPGAAAGAVGTSARGLGWRGDSRDRHRLLARHLGARRAGAGARAARRPAALPARAARARPGRRHDRPHRRPARRAAGRPAAGRLAARRPARARRRSAPAALLREDLDELAEAFDGHTGPLKLQVVGPWTLAAERVALARRARHRRRGRLP